MATRLALEWPLKKIRADRGGACGLAARQAELPEAFYLGERGGGGEPSA